MDQFYSMFDTNINGTQRLIKDYFLQLTIRFDSPRYTEQKDVPAVPLDALLAQMGGVLSLWLGVTIILIFELCEFLYNLICVCMKAGGRQSIGPGTIITMHPKDVILSGK